LAQSIWSIALNVVAFGLVLTAAGCKSAVSNAPANTNAASPNANSVEVKSKIDVCGLLTADDLKRIQGEDLKQAQRSDRRDGDFIVAQCYYALPTASFSVVLSVTTAGENQNARRPKAFWQETFAGKNEKAREPERESERDRETRGKEPKGKKDGEEEEGAPPEKVAGLGDDAYWIGSKIGGALYVLKQDVFFRLSVGGTGDEKAKLKRSKDLAQQVLKKI
jgi:hypothetical protein